ncbi:hypothetical protein H0H93_000216 [Arthromyces matolae]|nr:hypothetical protein H0H93_000216 [Arthromyces matolae]
MGTVAERTPFDVWVRISSYIPRDVVETLYGVNRSLFHIATASRYETVTLVNRDKRTKWLLQNLSNPNDSRGAVVREVIIEPWQVQLPLKPSHKRGASLWAFVCRMMNPDYAELQMERRVEKRLKKDIRLVTDAISAMPNLSRYSLQWKDRCSYHPELYRAFLTPVLEHIKGSLRILSLNVPPETLHFLAPVSLPHLESLSVHLCTMKTPADEIENIFDSFVVFVNNLYPSLESLSISTRVPSRFLTLDRFLSHLGKFPKLQSMALSIPFDGPHLKSTAQVVRFLDNHRQTLRHLQLTTSRCSDSRVPPESIYWIRNVLTSLDTPYPRLHSLHLAIRPLKEDILMTWMNFISSHSIDTLALTERSLTYNELKVTLEALGCDEFSHGLKHLRLRLKYLSPAILELLASKVPHLVNLELAFGDILATAKHQSHPGQLARSKAEEYNLFLATIRNNAELYASWTLVTCRLHLESPNALFDDFLHALADFIPAVSNTFAPSETD